MTAERIKVELTRARINELWNAASALEREPGSLHRRFSYAVAYNQDVIEREVKAFNKSAQKDEKYKAYDRERIELAERHAHKDRDDNPIMRNNIYVFKNPAAFERDLEALRKKHPAYQEREDYLEEVRTFEFHTVKMRFVPEYLNVAYMKLFRCFIEYEEEEFECPACGAELRMEGSELKKLYEEEETEEEKEEEEGEKEEVAELPPAKMESKNRAKRRRKRTG